MSSIASITTFGFGSYSTVNLAVMLGYSSGSGTAVTSRGGGLPIRRRKSLNISHKALDVKEYLEELYLRLYEPWNIIPKEITDEVQALVAPKQLFLPPPSEIDFSALARQANSIELMLKAYEAKILWENGFEEEEEIMMMSL